MRRKTQNTKSANFKRPNFSVYKYQRDNDSQKVYTLTESPFVSSLPPVIRIEKNQKKGKVQTDLIIRGKREKWNTQILTGLLPDPKIKDVYSGNEYKNQIRSFMLIKPSLDREFIEIIYLEKFMPRFPKQRTQLAELFASVFTV